MQHTVIVLMHDLPHALNRAISLFRRSAIRVDSLAVASSEQPGLMRMTLVVQRDDVGEVVRQLEGLIDVVSVRDVTHQRVVAHELCLVRVSPPGSRLGELLNIARETDARVVETGAQSMVLAIMGAPDAVSQAIDRLPTFGTLELTRSGRIAMTASGTPRGTAPAPRTGAPNEHYTWQADGAIDEEAA